MLPTRTRSSTMAFKECLVVELLFERELVELFASGFVCFVTNLPLQLLGLPEMLLKFSQRDELCIQL